MVVVQISYDPKTQNFSTFNVQGQTFTELRAQLDQYGVTGGEFFIIDRDGEYQLIYPDSEDINLLTLTNKPIYYLSSSVTKITAAIEMDDVQTIMGLVKPHDIAYLNLFGVNLLGVAIKHRALNSFKYLLDAGLAVKEEYDLVRRSASECFECLALLLERGSSPNSFIIDATMGNLTPLMKAVQEENIRAVEILLRYRADVNARNEHGWTALHYSTITNNPEIVKMLIGAGSDVNAITDKSMTPLHNAIMFRKPEISWILMNTGAGLELVDDKGCTPLHYATSSKDITYFLLTKGANPNALNNDMETPLHWAIKNNRSESAKFLISYGADVNVPDNEGETSLMLAVSSRNIGTVDDLLRAGALVNAHDQYHRYPIHRAIENNDYAVVERLINHGKDIDLNVKNGFGLAPLHLAINTGNNAIIKLLLEHGARPNEQNDNGNTPLHLASETADFTKTRDYDQIVKTLIEFGADPYIRNKLDQTPIDRLRGMGRDQLADFVIENTFLDVKGAED